MKMIHATAAWHTTINLYYQENRAKCYRPVAKCNGNKCRWSRIWKADMWELCRSWDCFLSLLCSSLHCAPSATWTVIMLAGTGTFSSTSYLLLSYIKKAMADWAQSTSRVQMGNIRWSCSSNPLRTWWMLSDLAACWIVDWHSKLKSPVLLAYHAGCSPSCLQWYSFLLVVSILSWKRHFFLWTGRMRSNNRDDLIIHSFLLLRMLNSLEEEQLLVQCTGLPDPWSQFWKYQENREGEKRQHWLVCMRVLLDGFVLTSRNAVTCNYQKGSNMVIHCCCIFGKLCCWCIGMDHLPGGIHGTVSDSVSSVDEV